MKSNINFQATGTTWQIDYENNSSVQQEGLAQAIKDRLEEYEHTYSRFRADSLLTQLANGEDSASKEYIFPEDSKYLFALYRDMYEATGGLVTPLIGQVISDAGYDADYSLKPKDNIQSAKKWDDVMSFEYPTLTLKESVRLDFGAIGKGYAIDIVGQLLKDRGITEYSINAGGDILHHGSKGQPIRVGLEHPNDTTKVIGIAEIAGDKSICGSAGNRRAWGEFHHIINPDTATSPKSISAVWAVVDGGGSSLGSDRNKNDEAEHHSRDEYSSTTALADALTTGLFFVEPSILSQRLKVSFEYLIIYANNTMKKSSGFPAEIF